MSSLSYMVKRKTLLAEILGLREQAKQERVVVAKHERIAGNFDRMAEEKIKRLAALDKRT